MTEQERTRRSKSAREASPDRNPVTSAEERLGEDKSDEVANAPEFEGDSEEDRDCQKYQTPQEGQSQGADGQKE